MDRLSGLDASFLYLETPAQLHARLRADRARPGHDAGAATRSTTMRDGIEARVRDVPDVHAQAAPGPARARPPGLGATTPTSTSTGTCTGWRCRRRAGTPSSPSCAGHLAGIPLDRSRPLWEMWVIEGYRARTAQAIAVFTKMHHATVDGVSGANLISLLCSLEPDAPPLERAGRSRRRGRTPERPRAVRPRAWSPA